MQDLLKLVRKFVLDYFFERSRPPVLEEIMQKFNLSRAEAFAAVKELEASRQLALLKGTQRVLMVFPFSSIPTPFRVTMRDGRNYFANCAWDSIALHVMLDKELTVDSYCHHCGEDVSIRLKEQKVVSRSPEEVFVNIGVPARKWWDDIVNTCSNNMTFFSSKRHLDDWLATNVGQRGEAITIEQTLRLSVPIYRDKMKIDYLRPSKDALQAHFESMGLTSDFWKL